MRHILRVNLMSLFTLLLLAACNTNSGTRDQVSAVRILGGDLTLAVGETVSLTAEIESSGRPNRELRWSTSDSDVASITPAGSNGSIATATARSVGTATITLTSAHSPNVSHSINVVVAEPTPELSLQPTWFEETSRYGSGATGVATDSEGNVTFVYSSSEAPTFGESDIYISSRTRTGEFRWGWRSGTPDLDHVTGVATDGAGNVYMVGHTFGNYGSANSGDADVLLASFDTDGQSRWNVQFGTSGWDTAHDVASDATGNVYVVGTTSAGLGGVNASGTGNIFVRAYSSAGAVRWTRQFGGDYRGVDAAGSVAIDGYGNIYVAGVAYGSLEGVDPSTVGNFFVRSYDQAGNVRWTRRIEQGSSFLLPSVAVHRTGYVYVAGTFDTNSERVGAPGGTQYAFVSAFDPFGTHQWIRYFGTPEGVSANGAAVDVAGNVYVVGHVDGALTGENSGMSDTYIRGYDSGGDHLGTRQFGSTNTDAGTAVATGPSGTVYVAGAGNGQSAGIREPLTFTAFVQGYKTN